MKSLFIFLSLFIAFSCGAQRMSHKYYSDMDKADSVFKLKQYKESSLAYLNAFAANGYKAMAYDRYYAACAMAMAGMTDSAFVQLEHIATNDGWDDFTNLSTDSVLTSLHSDKRWEKLCSIVKENKVKSDAKLNKPLIARLDTILNDDQEDRMKFASTMKKYGIESDEYKQLGARQDKKDSINVLKVTKILDEYGWLGRDVIGKEGNTTLFLVIQHADIKIQEKYLPMMREAVKKHHASGAALAMLEDRVALGQGRKQIYGSQVQTGADGVMYVSPLDDPDHVDKRREEVGLGPIAEYLQNWDIKWDVETYKKQLPELEKK
jgi:hypothetical protein